MRKRGEIDRICWLIVRVKGSKVGSDKYVVQSSDILTPETYQLEDYNLLFLIVPMRFFANNLTLN